MGAPIVELCAFVVVTLQNSLRLIPELWYDINGRLPTHLATLQTGDINYRAAVYIETQYKRSRYKLAPKPEQVSYSHLLGWQRRSQYSFNNNSVIEQ